MAQPKQCIVCKKMYSTISRHIRAKHPHVPIRPRGRPRKKGLCFNLSQFLVSRPLFPPSISETLPKNDTLSPVARQLDAPEATQCTFVLDALNQ